jgi:hypothetical protein
MEHGVNEQQAESDSVPSWLWRTAVISLSLVVVIGLAAALWLGTRPMVTGTPSSPGALGAWTFGPAASGGESGDGLVLRAREAGQVAFATSDLLLADFTVEVRAAPLSGPDDAGYGLVVRYRGPDEFVALLIGADGYIAVGQMSGGAWRWRVPWQQWPHIRRGSLQNLLRAQCRADRCAFYVNDEFAFAVDAVPPQGKVGPAAWSPEAGRFSAQFRDWRVWK